MRRSLALFLLAAAFGAAAATGGGRKAQLQQRQGDVRERIDTLQKDLAKKEETRADAADQLREVESAISATNRRLHELAAERREIERDLAELEAQHRRLERQTASQQDQLAHLLNRRLLGSETDALQLLLSGRDPNQVARDSYFLSQLSRAKAELIRELRGVAAQKRKLADDVRDRRAGLASVEKRQQENRHQLVEKQKQRQAMLATLAKQIKVQRREIGALKRDEQRLTTLIDRLAKAARAVKPAKVSRGEAAPDKTKPAPPAPAIRNADPGAIGAFGRWRGRLRLPTTGTVTARFGTPRAEGGTRWRGLFIRAEEGADVKAVGDGTVVFADWLRGFGNLLIVDHGDDYLSIYGNNQSLLRDTGQTVKAGEPIATVGNTGGNPDSGLYFELRHRGQAFDPLKWTGR